MLSEFLNLKPKTFGLDISDLSLKIIQLEKKGENFKLASFGETVIRPGVIKCGEIKKEDILVDLIKKAISEVKGKKIKTKYVIASLPEEKAFLQVIQMPCLAEEDLKSAVIYEAENYIPLPIEEVYLDYQIISPASDSLDHLDILIAALPKKTVDPYLNCLKKAGLKPLALEIESISIARALIEKEISNFPVLIIDLGATKTGFIIFSGSSLRFTFFIPVCSQEMTDSIARVLKVSPVKAEKLKLQYGLETKGTPEGGEVFESLIPPLTDLIEQIKKYFSYYQTHTSHEHLPPDGKNIGKILLCGGGANLKGLPNFLSRELKLPVRLGDSWVNVLARTRKETLGLSGGEVLKYTTAIGLALRGFKEN